MKKSKNILPPSDQGEEQKKDIKNTSSIRDIFLPNANQNLLNNNSNNEIDEDPVLEPISEEELRESYQTINSQDPNKPKLSKEEMERMYNKQAGSKQEQMKAAKQELSDKMHEIERRTMVNVATSSGMEAKEALSDEDSAIVSSLQKADPDQQFAIIQMGSKQIPPFSNTPHIRILKVVKTERQASLFMKKVKEHKESKAIGMVTTLPIRMQTWTIIPNCGPNLSNSTYIEAKAKCIHQRYLDNYQACLKQTEENFKNKTGGIRSQEQVQKKKSNKKKTPQKLKSDNEKKSDAFSNINLSSQSKEEKSTAGNANHNQKEEIDEEFEFVDEHGKKHGKFDLPDDLKGRLKFMSAIVIKDNICKKHETPEPLIMLLQAFETVKEAILYNKNIVNDDLSQFHLDVLSFYDWGDLTKCEQLDENVQIRYRKNEENIIMNNHRGRKKEIESFETFLAEKEKEMTVINVNGNHPENSVDSGNVVTFKTKEGEKVLNPVSYLKNENNNGGSAVGDLEGIPDDE